MMRYLRTWQENNPESSDEEIDHEYGLTEDTPTATRADEGIDKIRKFVEAQVNVKFDVFQCLNKFHDFVCGFQLKFKHTKITCFKVVPSKYSRSY